MKSIFQPDAKSTTLKSPWRSKASRADSRLM
jgi:hypothetical protein